MCVCVCVSECAAETEHLHGLGSNTLAPLPLEWSEPSEEKYFLQEVALAVGTHTLYDSGGWRQAPKYRCCRFVYFVLSDVRALAIPDKGRTYTHKHINHNHLQMGLGKTGSTLFGKST